MSEPPLRLAHASAGFSVRPALPSELDVLRSIDDDAAALYAEHGLAIELASDHPFVRDEQARWLRSAQLGRAFLALDTAGIAVGFAALDRVDGEPYLDQLAVRASAMRQGIGAALLGLAADWARAAGGSALWLTTYDHLPFNRAYYERHGFAVMPEFACGPGVRRHLDEERRSLPAPLHRVAMRRAV